MRRIPFAIAYLSVLLTGFIIAVLLRYRGHTVASSIILGVCIGCSGFDWWKLVKAPK